MMMSGWMPISRSLATDCWVGLVLISPAARMKRQQGDVDEADVLAADLEANCRSASRNRQALDVADRAADLGDQDVDRGCRLTVDGAP
jgi:predicted protein tyrosine phosphatase